MTSCLDDVRLSADDPGLAGGHAWLVQARALAWPKGAPAETWIAGALEPRRQTCRRQRLAAAPACPHRRVCQGVGAEDRRTVQRRQGRAGAQGRDVADGSPRSAQGRRPGARHRARGGRARALERRRRCAAPRARRRAVTRSCSNDAIRIRLTRPGRRGRGAGERLLRSSRRIWRPPPHSHSFRLLGPTRPTAGCRIFLPTRWKALGRPCDRALLDRAVSRIW